jgi:hypothetical protein
MPRVDPRLRTACGILLVVACQLGVAAVPAGGASDQRYIALGMSETSAAWKSRHADDESFLYVMDSATGRIEICSDVAAVCRSLPGSQRDARGLAPGRFVGIRIARATKAWKATSPADDHLVYTLDTATAQIQVCGDTEGACAVVSNGSPRAASDWPKVVMLYRRADSAGIAGRIYDRLVAHYGDGEVFMDVYSIPFGANWRDQVNGMSLNGSVLVALIGPRWLGPLPSGQLRISDLHDPVRTELEAALSANISVFPVLVEGATMPRSAELPDTLKAFADVNAATVDSGRDFNPHMSGLIAAIDRRLADRAAAAGKR